MVTRGGIRRALGDITGQQSNVVKVGCLHLLSAPPGVSCILLFAGGCPGPGQGQGDQAGQQEARHPPQGNGGGAHGGGGRGQAGRRQVTSSPVKWLKL